MNPASVVYVARRPQTSSLEPANEVDDYIVVANAVSAPANAVEDLDDGKRFNLESSLFLEFTADAFAESFAQLQHPSRN
jgi:hypothetical protein